jgi:hypothetical protein
MYTRVSDPSSYPVKANTTIYAGAFVAVDTGTGFAAPLTAAASQRFVGIALNTVTCGATGGAVEVKVDRACVITCTTATIGQADVGVAVYAADDNTVTKSPTTKTQVGVIERFLTTTSCRVRIIPTA